MSGPTGERLPELYHHLQTADLPAVRTKDLFHAAGESSWWRIVFPFSKYFLGWNTLRDFGPAPGCRFDPQPPPAGNYAGNGVIYLADSAETAVLEAFHTTRTVELADQPSLYECAPDLQGLDILDLRSGWSSRLGLDQQASQLHPRISSLLARRVRDANPGLAGMAYHSMRDGKGLCLVLWEPARAAMSSARTIPDADRTLRASHHLTMLARVANSHRLLILDRGRPL